MIRNSAQAMHHQTLYAEQNSMFRSVMAALFIITQIHFDRNKYTRKYGISNVKMNTVVHVSYSTK